MNDYIQMQNAYCMRNTMNKPIKGISFIFKVVWQRYDESMLKKLFKLQKNIWLPWRWKDI